MEQNILGLLKDEQVFYIEESDDKKNVEIFEGCDEYFSVELNKDQMLQLIFELQQIADGMGK